MIGGRMKRPNDGVRTRVTTAMPKCPRKPAQSLARLLSDTLPDCEPKTKRAGCRGRTSPQLCDSQPNPTASAPGASHPYTELSAGHELRIGRDQPTRVARMNTTAIAP